MFFISIIKKLNIVNYYLIIAFTHTEINIMTTTFNHAQIAPLMQKLAVAQEISQREHRTALKLKLRNKLQEQRTFGQEPVTTRSSRTSGKGSSIANHHPLFKDPSGNDALMLAARRGLIREHIAKVAIMKHMEMEDIPTFADVWQNYLERNTTKNQPKKKCTTSDCGCESSH